MIRLIIVGSGQVVRTTHLPNLLSLKDEVEVVGVADLLPERAEGLAAQFGIPAASGSYQDLVARLKPDAALVAVPNRFHAQTTIDLLQGGLHVFCEKPPATNGQDALRMEVAAAQSGKLLTYGFHFRHNPDVAFLQRLIQAGEFGALYHLDIHWHRRRGIPGWGSFTDKDQQGGGPLIDLGSHLLDLGLYFLDYAQPQLVLASQSDRIGRRGGHGFLGDWDGERFSVEDGLFAFIRFAGDLSITLSTSFAMNMEEKNSLQVSLYGDTLGADLFPLKLFGEAQGRQYTTSFIPEDEEDHHLKCLRNFLRAISGREALLVTARQGAQLQILIDAIYQSAESGRAVAPSAHPG
jgi:predicted dehydrogenase